MIKHPFLFAPCTLFALFAFWSSPAAAQLRDSFEGPERTWQISKEADCGVRILIHDRPFRDAHSGQRCEHFRLQVGFGTFVPLVHPIGRAPLIQELRPSLFVRADRTSLQLMLRVVFPRSIDRGTGQPIASLLRGDFYTEVGSWQQLRIRDVGRLLDQETQRLRTQFGPDVDPREAYADLLVLNAYSAPGNIDLWIDDLEIEGYLNLESATGPQVPRRAADLGSAAGQPGLPATVSVESSLLVARGRPFMPRAVQQRGEPFEWLQSLGFNTIKLSASPSAAELKDASRLGLWLIAPPPYSDQPLSDSGYEPVLAWSLGSRLAERDLITSSEMAAEVRSLPLQHSRPILTGVDSGLSQYSRLAQMLLLERPTLGTTQELSSLRSWILTRSRLSRPGTPLLAAIETQRVPRLGQQLVLFGRGAAWEEDTDPQQLRLQAFHAIAAGARGLVIPSESTAGGLAIDTGPAALRTDAIRLVNMELKLLEPWIAGGQLTEELAGGDGSVQVSMLSTDRSKLLILTQHAPAQQFVLAPPAAKPLSVLVPGTSVSDRAYLVSLAGVIPLQVSHASGGAKITLDNPPHAAAIIVREDPLAMLHLNRSLAEIKKPACQLRYDLTARRLAHTMAIDRRLTELGHPLATAGAALGETQTSLEEAQRLLGAGDVAKCHVAITKAENALARIRRAHWEQTAAAFPSPAASPCIAQFTTLPLHWTFAQRMKPGLWGGNVQAAGDMESLDPMLKAGWQQHRSPPEGIAADVSLSLSEPHRGRSALRLQAWAADAKKAPVALERPPVWVASSPVPVRQGQFVQISGWANVSRPITASTEGLLVFDSVGGSDLGDRIRLTQGWREFTLYRAVPESGELTVTFALTGLGEALIDDLSISLLDPDPIRP